MSNVPSVTTNQRLASRDRPKRTPIMYQSWIDLLFLHWKIPVDLIEPHLPKGLFVDTFDGDAFIGVVPFFMRNIRFRGTPSVPWVSNFLELNVRTYVHDGKGTAGVWFLSLDCNQPIAVWTARTVFHLPYQHARMTATKPTSSTVDYHSVRADQKERNKKSSFHYSYVGEPRYAQPETLEFFLAERYVLFSQTRSGQLYSGRVYHSPYPLHDVDVSNVETDLMELNSLPPLSRPYDHAIGSKAVHVDVFQLEKC